MTFSGSSSERAPARAPRAGRRRLLDREPWRDTARPAHARAVTTAARDGSQVVVEGVTYIIPADTTHTEGFVRCARLP